MEQLLNVLTGVDKLSPRTNERGQQGTATSGENGLVRDQEIPEYKDKL